MSTFTLPGFSPAVSVRLPDDLDQQALLNFPAFKTWTAALKASLNAQWEQKDHTFHNTPYMLRSIDVQAVDWFGTSKDKLGFVKLKAEVSNDNGESLPGSLFLRGGSVAMMIILQPDDAPEESEQEKHVILTVQPRIPAGSLSFVELPAGMLDDAGSPKGAAIAEIQEETGLEVTGDELIDLSEMTLSLSSSSSTTLKQLQAGEQLQAATYPSAGGSDEFIPTFLAQKRLPRHQIRELNNKLTGLRDHGEKITLQLCRLEDLWQVGARDAKALTAWALYSGLKRAGKI